LADCITMPTCGNRVCEILESIICPSDCLSTGPVGGAAGYAGATTIILPPGSGGRPVTYYAAGGRPSTLY
jgi:hypothetical protein